MLGQIDEVERPKGLESNALMQQMAEAEKAQSEKSGNEGENSDFDSFHSEEDDDVADDQLESQ